MTCSRQEPSSCTHMGLALGTFFVCTHQGQSLRLFVHFLCADFQSFFPSSDIPGPVAQPVGGVALTPGCLQRGERGMIEDEDGGPLLYDRRGVQTTGRRRTHPAAGLVAERPSLLTDGGRGQSLMLGRGGQLLVVSEPVQHAVVLAGFGGHSRHPAVEAEPGSITTITLNIPTVARQHGKVHHRSDDTNIPAKKSTPASRLHITLNSFQLFR